MTTRRSVARHVSPTFGNQLQLQDCFRGVSGSAKNVLAGPPTPTRMTVGSVRAKILPHSHEREARLEFSKMTTRTSFRHKV
jgi:hypothetical protein